MYSGWRGENINYKKIILVGFISAFVAILTSVLGVAGTVIGSVISSVLYNMLSEALEKPVTNASFRKSNFEWDIAYVFPIIVIAIIQLMLILALLAENGTLPSTFLNPYLSLQQLADNNLYRILGIALIIISVYPLILKPENVKRVHGIILAFVGLIFLARGFVDLGNNVTDIYDGAFIHFDLEIAIVAFVLILIVIIRVLMAALNSNGESDEIRPKSTETFNVKYPKQTNAVHNKKHVARVEKDRPINPTFKKSIKSNAEFDNYKVKHNPQDSSNSRIEDISNNGPEKDIPNQPKSRINRSSENIHFESNDLLEEYKK